MTYKPVGVDEDSNLPPRVKAKIAADVAADAANPASELGTALSASTAVPLVESGGTYPPRPAATPLAIFVGDTNPEAFMEDSDIWVPLAGDAALLDEPSAVALVNNATSDLHAAILAVTSPTELWIPARAFADAGGAVAPSDVTMGAGSGTNTRVLQMPLAGTCTVSTNFLVPAGWTGYEVQVLWMVSTTGGAGTGVRWTAVYKEFAVGAVTTGSTTVSSVTATVPTDPQYVLNATSLGAPVTGVTPLSKHRLNVSHLGDDAADTYASGSGVGLVGIRLVRA